MTLPRARVCSSWWARVRAWWRTRRVRTVLREPVAQYAASDPERPHSLRAQVMALRFRNTRRRLELLEEWGRLVELLKVTPPASYEKVDVLLQLGLVELQIMTLGGTPPPRPR